MKYHECPKCGKRIPNIILISAKYNSCCPNCDTPFTKFKGCDK